MSSTGGTSGQGTPADGSLHSPVGLSTVVPPLSVDTTLFVTPFPAFDGVSSEFPSPSTAAAREAGTSPWLPRGTSEGRIDTSASARVRTASRLSRESFLVSASTDAGGEDPPAPSALPLPLLDPHPPLDTLPVLSAATPAFFVNAALQMLHQKAASEAALKDLVGHLHKLVGGVSSECAAWL